MATLASIKEDKTSGYSKIDSDGFTIYLHGGRYGKGLIHFSVILHLSKEQLADFLTEQFYTADVQIEVSNDDLIIMA